LQVVVIDRNNNLFPIAQLEGHHGSEITGPAFSPDGDRLYFSSQRGAADGSAGSGVTFEISGPFLEIAGIFADGYEG
jgi:secreted PhoX family phosphatase